MQTKRLNRECDSKGNLRTIFELSSHLLNRLSRIRESLSAITSKNEILGFDFVCARATKASGCRLFRYLRALLACLGKADGNSLLSVVPRAAFTAFAGLQRASFHSAHRPFDGFPGG